MANQECIILIPFSLAFGQIRHFLPIYLKLYWANVLTAFSEDFLWNQLIWQLHTSQIINLLYSASIILIAEMKLRYNQLKNEYPPLLSVNVNYLEIFILFFERLLCACFSWEGTTSTNETQALK